MSNKVDSLFKKLEEHSLSPSARAWEKVEANLSKKNNTIAWVRVAAAVATVALLAFVALLWTRPEDVNPSQLVKQNTEKPAVPAVEEKKPEQQENQPAVAEQKPSRQTKKELQPKIQTEEKLVAEEIKEEVVAQEMVATQQTIAVVDQKEAPAKKESITLVFNLPTLKPLTPVEETIEPATTTVATAQEEEKRTTFQKAVDAANDLRSGDVLGNLREAKNDLFALDFKKDKTKKHN